VTDNLLNNKNTELITKENCKSIFNTENIKSNTLKNLITKDNPNLITGDTKSNERNEKNFMEEKVFVNIRDLIKQVKEREHKKIFLTAQKEIKEKDNLPMKHTKTKLSMKSVTKNLNFEESKKNYLNTINSTNIRKNDLGVISESSKNSMVRNNSAITKQKTEYKFPNKRFMTKEQKTKTKTIFIKKKLKNSDGNDKALFKSNENIIKTKGVLINNDNKKKENKENKENKEMNVNSTNRLFEIKYSATLVSSTYESKNVSERAMTKNLSDENMNKYNTIFTPKKKRCKKFKTKNNIIKKNNLINNDNINDIVNKLHLNNSVKLSSILPPNKRYKSFSTKNKNKINEETYERQLSHNSQKNIRSINILERIQELKQNKTKNDFYRTLRPKSKSKSKKDKMNAHNANTNNNTININNSVKDMKLNRNKKIIKGSFIKTPDVKNKKNSFYKSHLSRRSSNGHENKTKEENKYNCMSSLSIKVNKTQYNKEKEKDKEKTKNKDKNNKNKNGKNKNLKKTWTKTMKNYRTNKDK
jgi:hypothetical protein